MRPSSRRFGTLRRTDAKRRAAAQPSADPTTPTTNCLNDTTAASHSPPPRSAMVIVNPFAAGPVNVRNAYTAISKPSLDAWGTLYRAGASGISDGNDAFGANGGGAGAIASDGDIIIGVMDNEELFRGAVGRWLEEFSFSRLGSRGGKLAQRLVDDEVVPSSEGDAASPPTTPQSSGSGDDSSPSSTTSSSAVDVPESIIVFGGDGTVVSVVNMLHDMETNMTKKAVQEAMASRPHLQRDQSEHRAAVDKIVAETAAAVFGTPSLLVMPSGMGNSIAASLGTVPTIDKRVFAARVVGRDAASEMVGRSGGAASSKLRDDGTLCQEDGGATPTSSHSSSNKDVSGSAEDTSSSPRAKSSSSASLNFTSLENFAKSVQMRRMERASAKAERRMEAAEGRLQARRVAKRLPTYEVVLRPTGVALERFREDFARGRRTSSADVVSGALTYNSYKRRLTALAAAGGGGGANSSSSSSSLSTVTPLPDGFDEFSSLVGHCVGGISAGLFANTKIKAHMFASFSEERPGWPSLGSSAMDFAAMRELCRIKALPISVHVGRHYPLDTDGAAVVGSSQSQCFNPTPFSLEDCELHQLTNKGYSDVGGGGDAEDGAHGYKLVNISAIPCQGYGWSLTPAAAKGMGCGGRNRWSSGAAAAAGCSSSAASADSPFGDRIVVTTADHTAPKLRLAHLMFREARRNHNTMMRSMGADGTMPTMDVSPNAQFSFGMDTRKILCEDGVSVYGAPSTANNASSDAVADSSSFLSSPFTTAGLQNDSDVPLIALVDGSPVKIPPHFMLEMRPSGRSVSFWV